MKIGVAIFAYNRLNHLLNLLNSINNANNKSDLEFYIFHDGLKANSTFIEARNYYEVRSYLNTLNIDNIIFHNDNKGLGPSIIYGVNYIFDKFDYCIVLEDDLILSDCFFGFMKHYLRLYENNLKVFHINGFNGKCWLNEIMPDHYFTKFMSSWGWATWKNRWRNFNSEPVLLKKRIQETITFYNFNYENYLDFSEHLEDIINKKTKNWAVLWYATIYLNDGFCLNPKYSLVSHEGFDEFGTNIINKTRNNFSFDNFKRVELSEQIENVKESRINRYYIKESWSKKSKIRFKKIKNIIELIIK